MSHVACKPRSQFILTDKNNDKQVNTYKVLDQLKNDNKDLLSFEEAILDKIIDYKHIGYVGF